MEYWSIVLSIVISALGTHCLFRNFNFFKRHGIIHIPSVPILGAMAPIIFRRTSFADFTRRIYNFNRDAKYIGLYATTKPVLLLRDPQLIKAVLVKDFDTFSNRPVVDLKENVLTRNLFTLQNTKWREMRTRLGFFFKSGNMKTMFTLMSEYAVDFTKFMSTLPLAKSDVNMKEVFNRYTNDVIALCAYGIKIDSMKDPTNEFYTCGKDITHMSAIRTIKYIFVRTFPKLGRMLNIKLLNNWAINYFENSIKTEIATRDAKHITRPDMIQSIMDNKSIKNRIQLDVDDIVAQAYVLYFAGFETTSSVMSFIAWKIMDNPSIQIKLRQEIDKVIDETNGDVTYEVINKLEYLNAVIKEAIRLFSPSVLERVCDKAYKLPPALPNEKPFTVPKGMIVWIPLYAIHHDEKYYDDPEEFRPERFLDYNDNKDHDSSFYFPFGMGPKMCLGNRLSTLMIKVVLFHLLARCELKFCAKTLSIKFSKKQLAMISENGYWLNVQPRDDMHPVLKIANS